MLVYLVKTFSTFSPFLASILETLQVIMSDSVKYQKGLLNMRMQRCFAVKTGVNGVLDLSRTSYTELVDDVNGGFV